VQQLLLFFTAKALNEDSLVHIFSIFFNNEFNSSKFYTVWVIKDESDNFSILLALLSVVPTHFACPQAYQFIWHDALFIS
jgi:hypothetical protein